MNTAQEMAAIVYKALDDKKAFAYRRYSYRYAVDSGYLLFLHRPVSCFTKFHFSIVSRLERTIFNCNGPKLRIRYFCSASFYSFSRQNLSHRWPV